VGLGNVPVQVVLFVECLIALCALLAALAMNSGSMSFKAYGSAVTDRTFVTLERADVLVPELLVGFQVPGGEERLVTLVAQVTPHLVMHPYNMFPQLLFGLEFLGTLVAKVFVRAFMDALHVLCQGLLVNKPR